MFDVIKQKAQLGVLKTRVAAEERIDRFEDRKLTREAAKAITREAKKLEREERFLQRQNEIEELRDRLSVDKAENEITQTVV